MPKRTPYPRLRTHVRKGAKGQVWVSYFYDRRPEKDIPLGSDYDEAIKKWREIHEHKPRIAGTILEAMERWRTDSLPSYSNAETRKSYARQLKNLVPVFGPATWDQVGIPHLVEYLEERSAKTQANREMAVLSIVWNYARKKGYTKLPWPAAGMEKSKWKNKEVARQVEVSDALFAAVYSEAGSLLRDAMDLASATGLRLTDCRTVQIPPGDVLRVRASKTGKNAEFSLGDSAVLGRLVEARRKVSATHLLLLTTSSGRPVSARMLRDRWDEAREKAAQAHPELADELRAMFLRDMRKRASDLAANLEEASRLLQHSSVSVTAKHYRTKATKLRPVR
jgi:site-specific recombinase XerC